MKLRVPYEIMQVEGQSYAVPLEDSRDGSGDLVKLSKTAVVIFELLRNDTTEEAIVEEMSQRFDAPKGVIAADVHGVVEKLKGKGLLV